MKNILNDLIAERSAIKSRLELGLYELERKKVYDTIMFSCIGGLLTYHYQMMMEITNGSTTIDRESVLITMEQAYEEYKQNALELSGSVKMLRVGRNQISLFERDN